MNTRSNPRSLRAGHFSVALMAAAVASCSTGEAGDSHKLASVMKRLPPMSTEQREPSACGLSGDPATSVRLEGANGQALRLAYFAGCGWKYIAANRGGVADANLSKTLYDAVNVSSDTAPAGPEEPMTIFIDGPTGYTFAWTPAAGWKFVGHIQP
jgi:hypothetical protein